MTRRQWLVTVALCASACRTSPELATVNRTGFIGGLIPREDGPHGTPQ
jgi:hypothetical protein